MSELRWPKWPVSKLTRQDKSTDQSLSEAVSYILWSVVWALSILCTSILWTISWSFSREDSKSLKKSKSYKRELSCWLTILQKVSMSTFAEASLKKISYFTALWLLQKSKSMTKLSMTLSGIFISEAPFMLLMPPNHALPSSMKKSTQTSEAFLFLLLPSNLFLNKSPTKTTKKLGKISWLPKIQQSINSLKTLKLNLTFSKKWSFIKYSEKKNLFSSSKTLYWKFSEKSSSNLLFSILRAHLMTQVQLPQ